MPENDEDVNVGNTVQTPKISLSEELKDIETALQYFEQLIASVMDILFLRLRDEAGKGRVSTKTQWRIGEYYTPLVYSQILPFDFINSYVFKIHTWPKSGFGAFSILIPPTISELDEVRVTPRRRQQGITNSH
ncbi:hypothetical protein TNCV_3053131 [Trichonephila clavipes]|uniref:Uncharacterized protein n=1 Tax=Trichonephila clavipes TaxID=2585209 RepID=A0A8X6RQ06_TRICX|nr:hypothetical protein TNCV_3053131 [Trichonephila clavipes]